jgi:SAM-dependent methyltransferase
MDNWFAKLETAWSSDSDGYDLHIQKQLKDKSAVRHWKNELGGLLGTEPLRILDVGCGPGFFSMILFMLGHNICSVDGAEGMVRHAEENIKKLGFSPDVHLADAVLLEQFHPGSFDAIVSRDVVWTLYDPPKAFRRWKELLREGGKLIVFDGDYRRDHTSLRYYSLKFVSDVIKFLSREDKNKWKSHGKDEAFHELLMIKHERPAYDELLLKESGFETVEVRPDYFRNTPFRFDFWKYGYQGKKFRVVAYK